MTAPGFCTQCGSRIDPGAPFCAACGTALERLALVTHEPVTIREPVTDPLPAPTQPRTPRRRRQTRRQTSPPAKPAVRLPTDNLAIVAFAASVTCLAGLGTLLGLILGHASLRRIARADGRLAGARWALAALAVSYASLASAAAVAVWIAVKG